MHYLCLSFRKRIIMKAFISTVISLVFAFASFGQTAHDIVTRMDEEMAKHQDEGMELTMDLKIPLLGTTTTRVYYFGKSYRMDSDVKGYTITAWSDGKTMWTYDPTNNQIEVDNVAVSSTNDNVEMLKGITEGYDVSLSRETASAWYILCRKSKSNTNKDDPRTMDLVVSKGTYLPISLSAKVSVVTVTMRNVKYGVNESLVKFNPEDYPGATIVDKR